MSVASVALVVRKVHAFTNGASNSVYSGSIVVVVWISSLLEWYPGKKSTRGISKFNSQLTDVREGDCQ